MRAQRSLPAAVTLLVLLASGCSLLPWGKGEPAPIRVSLEAAARLNPDEQGESLPTSVRVYQLASVSKAQAAELSELLRDPKEVLGDDLLGFEELLVAPGGRTEKLIPREKEARALLVAALFRRPAGTAWRELVELRGGRSARLEFWLEDYRLVRR